MFCHRLRFALGFVAGLACSDCACLSQAGRCGPRLTVQSASVGFGGKFKAGFWQPVRLTLVAGPEGATGRLEVVVPDGDQTPVVYANESVPALKLTAGEKAEVVLYAKSG